MSFPVHPWKVVERGWQPNTQRFAESLMSLANGYMGLRGNFEEDYSGDSFQGTYLGGVWYPDKTRVGWWKKGYPEYYAKVINAINLIGIHVIIDQHPLDLSRATVWEYEREVDMRTAVLYRHACVDMDKGSLTLDTWRFVSMDTKELLAIRYQVTPSFDCRMEVSPYLDGNVRNVDANYDQSFWNMVDGEGWDERGGVLVQTKPNPYGVQRFTVAAAMTNRVEGIDYIDMASKAGYCAALYAGDIHSGTTVSVEKYVAVFTSRDHDKDQLMDLAMAAAQQACDEGWQKALKAHQAAWHERWEMADVQIEGDDSAQQGIHFNLFQLLSTYTGSDARLNIGPKGYTGERFGGSTYWDTEAYCLPVFLAIRGADTARQLLLYRYHHLEAAKRNAANLGMPGALYPVSTINGSECHNEWEVAFEGIHRNAAIVHAIFEYTMYTGDETYLLGEGVEVMAEIAKFWVGRVHFNQRTQKYMIFGVTGPNEYENNVNNNWYTSYIACWSMRYAARAARWVRENRPADYARICAKRAFDEAAETAVWHRIADNMYLGEDRELGIFLQQDGYLDKEQTLVADLDPAERPINQKWSWDRILRSCFIKQADVLQGLYFFGEEFDLDTLRRNFYFYEPRTVHESSLSPCVHAVLAARLGDLEKAVEMYLRTARLDLDDYNREVAEGCHVTSMAGSWLSVVEGFGGMCVRDGVLSFDPRLPETWESLSFKVNFRGRVLTVKVTRTAVEVSNEGDPVEIALCGRRVLVEEKVIMNSES